MSDSSRWWALDLVLVVFLADVAGAAIYLGAPGFVRLPLALLLVLVLPGYALTAVFFPARNPQGVEFASLEDEEGGLLDPLPADYEVGSAERVALSMALSVAIVPAVAAVASFTPRGIALEPILGGVIAVTVGLAVVAFLRRLRLPPARRYGFSPAAFARLPRPFEEGSRLHRNSRRVGTFNLVALVGLLLVLASVAFAIAAPPQAEPFTEFYVVTDDATGAESTPYPSTFRAGRQQAVALGVANHEHRDVRYTIVATQAAADGDRAVIGRTATTVPDGETREVDVGVQPTRSGEDVRLRFLLYRGEPPGDPTVESAYRVLDLSASVSGS